LRFKTKPTSIILFSLIYLLQISLNSFAEQKRIWIDYDIAFGKKIFDIDDGLALIHILKQKNFKIEGISLGFGNIKNLSYMEKITKKILKKSHRSEIPIFKGAHKREDLGIENDATYSLNKALKAGRLTIINMGRLTNLATLLTLHPEVKTNIEEVIVNAGRQLETESSVGPKKIILPDTNIDDDLPAAKIVLQYNLPITMIPTELMKDRFFTKNHRKTLKKSNAFNKWIGKQTFLWSYIWKIYFKTHGFIPFDLFMSTYLSHPQDFKCLNNIPYDLKILKNNTSSLFRKKYKKDYKEFLVASYKLPEQRLGKYCFFVKQNHLDSVIESWSK